MGELPEEILAEIRALLDSAHLSETARQALLTDEGRAYFERRLRQDPSRTMVPEMFTASHSLLEGTELASNPIDLDGTVQPRRAPPRQSRYEDLGQLGQGGMGIIRRVLDPDLNRVIALKIIRPERLSSAGMVARFIEEAQISAQLTHPGIVPVHELGRLPDGRYYFTMKEIQGRTLSEVIRSVHHVFAIPGDWNVRRMLKAFLRVCEAVAYAHSRGVVHRDIKPSNIMIGEFGEVMVMDWGLAKVLGRPDRSGEDLNPVQTVRQKNAALQTRIGRVSGTPTYMPPEQASGRIDQLGPPSDVYSLGAVLFEIISGYAPFPSGDQAEVLAAVQKGQRLPLPEDHMIPEGLKAICNRAMALRPSDRYPDAEAFSAELRDWLEGATRRSEALAVVEQADAMQPQIAQLHQEAAALRQEAAALLSGVAAWEPESRTGPGWQKEDRAAALEREAELLELSYLQTLQTALKQEPGLLEAHQKLSDHYQRAHQAAEARHDTSAAALNEVLLRSHDRGRHLPYLIGDGRLTLVTEPPGVSATLYRYTRINRRLVPTLVRQLGRTPLVDVSLPMGSYLVKLSHPDHVTVRYPVHIGRQAIVDGIPPGGAHPCPVPLPLKGALPEDACYVPAGWFAAGGDPDAYQSLPASTIWCDGLLVQTTPVTNAAYLRFLNHLLDTGREAEALTLAPRERGHSETDPGALLLGRDAEGHFILQPDTEGTLWLPRWPVVMVDHRCARAYADWLAQQTGLPWRLPYGLEREKAARGVDGRFFPWGDFAHPAWSCTQLSHPDQPILVEVDTYPVDVSPYGVRHTGGLIREWCADVFRTEGPDLSSQSIPRSPMPAEGVFEVRGGSWNNRQTWARAALRFGYQSASRFADVGFRLVCDATAIMPQ
jgi:formylglycine-generating enzyme required for sulfatase activity/tRNA A-37 threonylcarbamoyl transferase component Bud32